MKKFIFLIVAVLLLMNFAQSQELMVAGWTFPGNSLAADTGVSVNLTQEIITVGGTSAIELKNGFTTKAAQASGWDEGMDTKGWVVALSTSGFGSLTVSSRQQSGGTDPGPKYFKLQYSIDGGESWNDVENGDITVENDWETSHVDQLPLPAVCDNIDDLMLRWLMASDEASGSGGTVPEEGKSKIDEIFIRGEQVNAIPEQQFQAVTLIPGVQHGWLQIRSQENMKHVIVRSISGQVLKNLHVQAATLEIDLSSHETPQIILVTVMFQNGRVPHNYKFFLF